jgi:mannose-1-phosphate guanylyltransferase
MAGAIHVVVLAAGRGSRLAALGEEVPKWLLDVGGRTLADRQLEGIEAASAHVASVRVVTGHGAPAIDRFLAARGGTVAVKPVFNPQYAELNNWWSVLVALRDLPADGAPVAILNSDLLAAPSWVGAFLEAVASSSAEGLLAVDLERELTDESMKVELRDDGALGRIGKVGHRPRRRRVRRHARRPRHAP